MSSHNRSIDVTQEEFDDLLQGRSSTDPVPILQHKAENRIRRELREVALRGCIKHIEDFARCAQGKTISVAWTCRSYNQAMDKCMKSFGMDEALMDEMRRRHALKFPRSVKGYKDSVNSTSQMKSTTQATT